MSLFILLAGAVYVGIRSQKQRQQLKAQQASELGEVNEPMAIFVQQPRNFEELRSKPHLNKQRNIENQVDPPIVSRQMRNPFAVGATTDDTAAYRQTNLNLTSDFNPLDFHREWLYPREDDLYQELQRT